MKPFLQNSYLENVNNNKHWHH